MARPTLAKIVQRKIVTLVLLPMLAFALLLGAFIAIHSSREIERANLRHAKTIGRYIYNYFSTASAVLTRISFEAREYGLEQASNDLRTVGLAFPFFDRLVLIDQDGVVVMSEPGDSIGKSYPLPQSHSQASGVTTYRPVISPTTGNLTVHMIRRINDAGSIVGELSLRSLQSFISDSFESETDRIILTDSFGNVIVHPAEVRVRQQANIAHENIFRAARKNQGGVFLFEDNDSFYLGASQMLPETGWIFIFYRPLTDIFKPIMITLMVILGGFLLFSWMMILLLRRRMRASVVEPFLELSGYIEQSGDTPMPYKAPGPNDSHESAVVTEAYSRLAERVGLREKELKESEEKYRKIVENAVEGIFHTTETGRFEYANPALAHMIGYDSPEELIANITDISTQLYHDPVVRRDYLDQLRKQGKVTGFEARMRRRDGRLIWASLSSWTVRDKGRIHFIEGIIEDITARKQAEEELRSQRDLLAGLFDNILLGIVILDSQGRVLHVNKGFTNLTGYTPEEMRTADDWFERAYPDPERRKEVLKDWQESASQKRTLRQHDIACKDGNNKHLEFRASFLPDGRALVTMADASERQRTEQAMLRAKEAAEAASSSKSEFLANMSHEIRTPINGVAGMLQLLQDSPLDREAKDYVDKALLSCRRLTNLLSDILDISAVEAGKLTLAPARFRPESVLRAVENLFNLEARGKGLELRIELSPEIPATLVGDEQRLQQILFNLVGNALKFTESGSVIVQAHPLPDPAPDKKRVLFMVSDTGAGIPDELYASIFEPFSQADQGYTRTHQGAGLGLSIVKRLVAMMQGVICLESTPGQGSTFHISLPFGRDDHPEQEPEEQSEGDRPIPRRRILLVEDERINRLAIRRMLEKLGQEVEEAATGVAALEMLREEDFDLVLMDIQMPVLDGIEATRAIRNGEAGAKNRDLPVVALTAYAMVGDKETFFAAGMNDYLPKPVDLATLGQMLARLPEKSGGKEG